MKATNFTIIVAAVTLVTCLVLVTQCEKAFEQEVTKRVLKQP